MRKRFKDFEGPVRNVKNYIFITNNPDPIPVSSDTRRFFVLKVSDCRKGDEEYFRKLAELSQDEEFLAHFLTYLLRFDLAEFNPFAEPPRTEALQNLIAAEE
jgi:hypothetical protein